MNLRLVTSSMFLLLAAPVALAQEKPARPEPQVVELSLRPAAEPTPALKHRLLPPFLDRSEENAAPLYLKALLLMEGSEGAGVKGDDKVWENLADWSKADLDKLPQDEVRAALVRFKGALDEVRIAAHRERCDWALGVRDRKNVFATLLPEVQSSRNIARLLAVEARLHMAEGKYDEALRTLQIGYALARHVAQQPFLVSGLVGLAISQLMSEQLETLIAADNSPNMYWALAALPDPLVDLRPALELEGNSLFLMFPELLQVRERKLTADQWRQEFRDTARSAAELMFLIEPAKEEGLGGVAKEIARAAALEALLELRAPAARKQLLEWGYDAKRLDAMPKGQLALVHEVEYFERARDDVFKWFEVPYWQAYDGMQAANAAFAARSAKRDKLAPPPVADLVLPAMGKVYDAQVRVERRIAALAAVESLRLHASAHEGRLPMHLKNASAAAPIPINPFTGELPDYSLVDETATLIFAGRGSEADLVYRVRFAKAK